jgi:sigma-B regulation protein RsbU (phosphoserine phosphatase)
VKPPPDLLTTAGNIYFETHFAPLLKMQRSFNEVALDVAGDAGVIPVLVNAVQRDARDVSPAFIGVHFQSDGPTAL